MAYIIPENATPTTWLTRTFCIPDDPLWMANGEGALSYLTFPYVWDADTGDVDEAVETAKKIYYSLIGIENPEECPAPTMTCEDIINCIETDADTRAALLQYLNETGFTSNPGSTIPTLTMSPSQTAENLLPASYSCTDGQMMATARSIVVEVNRAIVDLLESFELITDPSELLTEVADNFEGLSWLSTPLEVANWFQDEIAAVYNAAYTYDVETALSCAIYCAMLVDCEITLDMLISVAQDEMGSITPPPDPDDYQALFDWFIEIDTAVGTSVVGACFYLIFNLMRFAASITDIQVIADLKQIIDGSVGQSDNSYTLCDDCPPTETPNTFWYMDFDFSVSSYGFVSANANAQYLNGGWQSVAGNPVAITIRRAISPTLMTLAGIRTTSLRRGSTGNGTFDYKRLYSYPNENFTGTQTQQWNSNFIAENDNEVVRQKIDFVNGGTTFKSIAVVEALGSNFNAVTATTRIYRVELWGWNNGDVKPDGAIWVPARV